MSNASVQYRFRIYSTDDSTVETTFDQSDIESWDHIGGQEVRALEGRAETRPWSIRVVDVSSGVTNDLADSSGRLRRIGRLADFQQNLDSSGWATLGTGRISDVFLTEAVASYQFVMEDEHYKARNALIFNSTSHDPTCFVYPPGLRSYWMNLPPRRTGTAKVRARSGNLSLVVFDSTAAPSLPAMRELESDYQQSTQHRYDTNTTQGNFRFLRFRADGTDYEVFALGTLNLNAPAPDLLGLLKLPAEDMKGIPTWVVDPSTSLAGGAVYPIALPNTTVGVIATAYLYSPGAPPSPGQPWHIGGQTGQHPYTILQDIYDGDYGGPTIRYDTTAFTNAINNKLLPQIGFQITSPRQMAEFTEHTLYAPFGGVGFVNRDGRIMPRSIFMPSTADVDQSSLFRFTGANLRAPHPTWEHTRRELITVIDLPAFSVLPLTDREVVGKNYDIPCDFVQIVGYGFGQPRYSGLLFQYRVAPPTIYAAPIEHDRLSIGRILHRIENEAITGIPTNWAWRQILARELFDRYGDGPIQGQLYALSSGTSGVLPGDFVRINLATYPNMGIQGRGSTRFAQILSVMDTPYGPVFDYLDAGPDQSPLTAPTLTMSSSTEGSPTNKHRINATIGGVPSYAGAGVELQIARDDGSLTVPSSNSTRWGTVGHFTSSGTYPVDRLPNGDNFWGRARARAAGFWRSAWTYTTETDGTDTLVAASGLATSTPTQNSVNMSWNNSTASTGYPLHVGYQTSAGSTFTIADSIPAGTNRYAMKNMNTTTEARSVQVRYYDPFGGFSNPHASSAFSSTATATAATVGALTLIYGIDTTGEVY